MVIASRILKLKEADGTREIPVRLFLPELQDNSWKCGFEIDWPDGKLERFAWGADSVQSLVHALQMIGAVIYTSEYHESGQLFVDETVKGYGFPVVSTLRDLLAGDDQKYL